MGNGQLSQGFWIDGKVDAVKGSTIGGGSPSFANVYVGTCNARGINNNMPDSWFHFKGKIDEVRANFSMLSPDQAKDYDLLVTEHPADVTLMAGQTLTLTCNHTDFSNGTSFTYQWYKDGQEINVATSKTYTKTFSSADAGKYHCIITNNTANQWWVATDMATISFNNGISRASQVAVQLYPNPASGIVQLSSPATLTITDLSGKTVLATNASVNTADVSGLAKGIYIATLTSPAGQSIQKIVIE